MNITYHREENGTYGAYAGKDKLATLYRTPTKPEWNATNGVVTFQKPHFSRDTQQSLRAEIVKRATKLVAAAFATFSDPEPVEELDIAA